MAEPALAPCLLFPCGHSLCAQCVLRNLAACPSCGKAIANHAPNVALQHLLQTQTNEGIRTVAKESLRSMHVRSAPPPEIDFAPAVSARSEQQRCVSRCACLARWYMAHPSTPIQLCQAIRTAWSCTLIAARCRVSRDLDRKGARLGLLQGELRAAQRRQASLNAACTSELDALQGLRNAEEGVLRQCASACCTHECLHGKPALTMQVVHATAPQDRGHAARFWACPGLCRSCTLPWTQLLRGRAAWGSGLHSLTHGDACRFDELRERLAHLTKQRTAKEASVLQLQTELAESDQEVARLHSDLPGLETEVDKLRFLLQGIGEMALEG